MIDAKLDETAKPSSCNMKLTEFWKKKCIEVLQSIYGDGLVLDKVSLFLDNLIANSAKPMAQLRNIYEERVWEVELNDIPKIIHENHLICGANGSYTYEHKVKMSELSELLIKWLKERSELKNKAILCDESGDIAGSRKYDNLQNSRKESNNSTYGVSAMNGYILYSPDTASMITSQGRELISEMMWTLEKFLGSNMVFKTMNEFYSFINESLRDNISIDMIRKYNIKIPSFSMLTKRLKELLYHIPEEEKKGIDNNKSIFLMLKNIEKDPVKAINFYYKYNLYEFLRHNPKVMGIIDWIMVQNKQFNSPLPGIMKNSEASVYIEPINELVSIFMHFVILPLPTNDRMEKYKTRGRYIIPISDTDSVITRLDSWIEFVSTNGKVKFDTFYDDSTIFRSANIMAYICTEICNFMGRNMAKHCYVPEENRGRINLKNEFFFKSLILYPNIKKNYSAWTIMREGVAVNKVSNTGLALEGSNINPYVKSFLKKLIFEEIHSVKDVSVTNIMRRIYELERNIRDRVLNDRDISFAKYSSYKTSYRTNPFSDSRVRAVELWNHIYPDNKIEPYNKIYIINTVLEREEQINLINDLHMREVIHNKIFKFPADKSAVPFGLRTIAIPDSMKQYPLWLKDIIDVNKLIEHHINSITSLLPAIGVFVNRINSTRNHVSSLISLN